MQTMPLLARTGHLYTELVGELWLLDTGAPTSFGRRPELVSAGETFALSDGYLGLTDETLSEFVEVECAGLLGADVLGRFDALFDVPGGRLVLATDAIEHAGERLALDDFMGIPIVTAQIGGEECRMFLDTGAQLSYLQDEALAQYPAAGRVTDFYPGLGRFDTDTHWVPIGLGKAQFTLRCGTLPGLLGMTLALAGTDGIIGNAFLNEQVAGYFPRRNLLVL